MHAPSQSRERAALLDGLRLEGVAARADARAVGDGALDLLGAGGALLVPVGHVAQASEQLAGGGLEVALVVAGAAGGLGGGHAARAHLREGAAAEGAEPRAGVRAGGAGERLVPVGQGGVAGVGGRAREEVAGADDGLGVGPAARGDELGPVGRVGRRDEGGEGAVEDLGDVLRLAGEALPVIGEVDLERVEGQVHVEEVEQGPVARVHGEQGGLLGDLGHGLHDPGRHERLGVGVVAGDEAHQGGAGRQREVGGDLVLVVLQGGLGVLGRPTRWPGRPRRRTAL